MNKKMKEYIKSSIHNLIDSRKNYNYEYKKLLAEKKKEYNESDNYELMQWRECFKFEEYINSEINSCYRRHLIEKASELLENFHYNESFMIIYKNGTQSLISAEEILTGEVKGIDYSNWAYAYMLDAGEEMDTDTGELEYDISIDEEAEAHEEYMHNIEVKYGTEWGKKHAV